MTIITLIMCTLVFVHCELDFKYHSNVELFDYLFNYTIRFPNISQVYSIGQTVLGTELLVVKVTTTKDILAPNVKLIGNIHGNEPIGREILLQFLEYIGENHSVNNTLKHLLSNTILHILPTLNPDGFTISNIGQCDGMKGRNNANEQDLNRNFPDYYQNVTTTEIEQPETKAIKNWMDGTTFSLSASLHSGELVANYPFDSAQEFLSLTETIPSFAPDNDVLQHLALVYSEAHPVMHKGNACEGYFKNGITNGAKWYSFQGGMQDYNYAFKGTMELTLELSCCKYPLKRELKKLWIENQKSLITFCNQANFGLRGNIVDYNLHPKREAISLRIQGRNILFFPDKVGRFWRILLPGRYSLQVLIEKKLHKSVRFEVKKTAATTINLNLLQLQVVDSDQNVSSAETTNMHKMTTFATQRKLEFSSTTTSTFNFSGKRMEAFQIQNVVSNASQLSNYNIFLLVLLVFGNVFE